MNVYETRRTKLKCLVLGAAGAGKTSILRRYFTRKFDAGVRVPTKGSDFYIGKLTEPLTTDDNDNDDDDETREIEVTINLEMWDTPGRERFYLDKRRKQLSTASLADPFLEKADACMLVYDMTSSTSFTQLLRWYADLMEILQNNKKRRNNKMNGVDTDFPILIVGNKLDVFKATQQRATTVVHPRRVRQRDVMGLHGRNFKGKDFQYEYRVSPVKPGGGSSSSSTTSKSSAAAHKRHTQRRESLRQEVSSFLANRENWTKDNSYLDSLLNSEDESHPDRDMVLLWCMRNGLEHLEVSAATGEGVDHAVVTLARMALEHKLDMEYQQQEQLVLQQQQLSSVSTTTIDNGSSMTSTLPILEEHQTLEQSLSAAAQQSLDVHRPHDDKLDLQERYRSRDANSCCFGLLPPLSQWLFMKQLS